jgi:hypothetical protein
MQFCKDLEGDWLSLGVLFIIQIFFEICLSVGAVALVESMYCQQSKMEENDPTLEACSATHKAK